MIVLPHVDYGVGRRQIHYEWPELPLARVRGLEAFLRQRDYDYPGGCVRVDGFRIEPTTPGFLTKRFGALYEYRRHETDDASDEGVLVRAFGFQENYWRKPMLSRAGLLVTLATFDVKRVRGYDLPLGHRCTCGCSLGMDDACDAIIEEADIFEVELAPLLRGVMTFTDPTDNNRDMLGS